MKQTIYLAGGCFWGMEHLFSLVPGVLETCVGYANTTLSYPSYEEVCSGATGAAETVKVTYDDTRVSLADLLSLFFRSIDPLALNRQGNDCGTQYRTGIYYTDAAEEAEIEDMLAELQRRYSQPIAIECLPLKNFYPAEEYHQKYLDKNPGGYCHVDPALFREAATMPQRGAGK